jgi:hypothetical protein
MTSAQEEGRKPYDFELTDDPFEAAELYTVVIAPLVKRARQAGEMDAGQWRDRETAIVAGESAKIDQAFMAHKKELDAVFVKNLPQYRAQLKAQSLANDEAMELAWLALEKVAEERARLLYKASEATKLDHQLRRDAGLITDPGVTAQSPRYMGKEITFPGDSPRAKIEGAGKQVIKRFTGSK